jgi:hypothetical protein
MKSQEIKRDWYITAGLRPTASSAKKDFVEEIQLLSLINIQREPIRFP